MNTHYFDTPVQFLERCGDFLQEREAENCLLAGSANRLAQSTPQNTHPLLASVENNGKIVLAATRIPPHRLVLTRAEPVAVAVLADSIARRRMELPGVVAPADTAADFAAAWEKLANCSVHSGRRMDVFQASRIEAPAPLGGMFAQATPDHLNILTEWLRAFREEVGEDVPSDDRAITRTAIAENRVFVWLDPQPVSAASFIGETAHGVRINTVYTPPSYRRRGYAAALVAALSQRLLSAGRTFCFLFTDVRNRSARGIYRRMGYEPVSRFGEFRFERR